MYEVCKKEFVLIFVKLSIYDVFIEFRSKNIYTCRIHSMYMRTKEFFCAKGYFVIFSTRFFFSFFNFLCKIHTPHIIQTRIQCIKVIIRYLYNCNPHTQQSKLIFQYNISIYDACIDHSIIMRI